MLDSIHAKFQDSTTFQSKVSGGGVIMTPPWGIGVWNSPWGVGLNISLRCMMKCYWKKAFIEYLMEKSVSLRCGNLKALEGRSIRIIKYFSSNQVE